jgi:hypothetical protein
MPTNFPTSLDNFTNPVGTDDVSVVVHSTQHANHNDAIEALEAKVGINGSAVATSLDYRVAALESGGSSAFNDITSGTNTTAAMVVGSGSTLAATGTGTITPTTINGLITAGTNISLSGSGTAASPYEISSTGGSGLTEEQVRTRSFMRC